MGNLNPSRLLDLRYLDLDGKDPAAEEPAELFSIVGQDATEL